MKTLTMVPLLTSVLLAFSGCESSGNRLGRLERDLAQALARYETSESKFSSSDTYDQLIVNAGWLDRMAEAVIEIERIEARAVAMGSVPIPEIRQDIASRFRRRFAAFKSDAEYLDVMSELKRAGVYIEVLSDIGT